MWTEYAQYSYVNNGLVSIFMSKTIITFGVPPQHLHIIALLVKPSSLLCLTTWCVCSGDGVQFLKNYFNDQESRALEIYIELGRERGGGGRLFYPILHIYMLYLHEDILHYNNSPWDQSVKFMYYNQEQ